MPTLIKLLQQLEEEKEMNYTKGEWRVVIFGLAIIIKTFSQGISRFICVLRDQDSDEEIKANANLISAAPEMYEALNNIIAECPTPTSGYEIAVVEIAKKALAKAEGKS